MLRREIALAALVCSVAVLGACNGGDDDPEPTTTTSEPVSTTTVPATSAPSAPTATGGAAAGDVRDWDNVRFDIGIVDRIDRTEDGKTLVVFDRVQIPAEDGSGKMQEAKDFTEEPIVVSNQDEVFVNENKRLRTYVVSPRVEVVRWSNRDARCEGPGNGPDVTWAPMTIDQAVSQSIWRDMTQVSLTFDTSGQVTRIRFADGC